MSTQSGSGVRRVTVPDVQRKKAAGERIAALTAYDYLFARLVDAGGADIVLVGDSLGQVVLGLPSTLSVTLEQMIHHAAAVQRGVERALVVVDLPFLSYQISVEDALRNAGRVMKETGVGAVKLEGGSENVARTVHALAEIGIPVMGHLGFTPQSVHRFGGFRVQGREEGGRERLLAEASRLQEAGAFALVLELMPAAVAQAVTQAIQIPTIGIGAGAGCDGQVLVLHDMLGLNPDFRPRFLRRFAELGSATEAAVRSYVDAVRAGEYPAAEHSFE